MIESPGRSVESMDGGSEGGNDRLFEDLCRDIINRDPDARADSLRQLKELITKACL